MDDNSWVVVFGIFLVVLIGMIKSQKVDLQDYLYAGHSTSLWLAAGSILASTIGANALVVLFGLTLRSPVTALGITVSAVISTVLLGRLVAPVRAAAQKYQAWGIMEFLASSHDMERSKVVVQIYIGYVILMKLATQLLALSLVLGGVFNLGSELAIFASSLICFSYIFFGGYKAATITDAVQAVFIIALAAVLLFFIPWQESSADKFMELGGYPVWMSVAFPMIYPFSLFLSPASWHRMATGGQVTQVRKAYYFAAPFVGLVLLTVVALAVTLDGPVSPRADFESLSIYVPEPLKIFVLLCLMMAILSTMDTMTIPLIVGASSPKSLVEGRVRLLVIVILISLIAVYFEDIVAAAFSGISFLLALFPAVIRALFFGKGSAASMVASTLSGAVAGGLAIFTYGYQYSAPAVLLVSSTVYCGVVMLKRYRLRYSAGV